MMQTDIFIISLIELILIGFTVLTIFKDYEIRKKVETTKTEGGATAEVERGKISMTKIYTVYGAAIAACVMLIDSATGLEGNKVILISINFSCITYIFFFSSWFRNTYFFPLSNRIRLD